MAIVDQKTRRYFLPILLFGIGLFFQLVVLPNSFPPSHYYVLGVKLYASIEDVEEAYRKMESRWLSGSETPTTSVFIKVRYAFELLTNPIWKRDYDHFGIDEQLHVIGKVKEQYEGLNFSDIHLPLLGASLSDNSIPAFNVLTPEKFVSMVGGARARLIQVYSDGSPRCAKFFSAWKRIANLLDEVIDVGMVELGDTQLASYLAERKSTQQPFFRNGLPALVALPPNCRGLTCYMRYQGDQTVDAIVDWVATDVLGLPRIPYYTKETLVPKFFAKSSHHKVTLSFDSNDFKGYKDNFTANGTLNVRKFKDQRVPIIEKVKVISFSKTGERAVPFLRQAAKDYWAYASFSMVLWREEESNLWWNMFNVESAPAIVILKDPGVQPVVHHGSLDSSEFTQIIESNKHQVLPQLRSATSMELGCDAKGFSRAGNNMVTWYCVILAGRPSRELNKMRDIMRKAQRVLSGNSDLDGTESTLVPAPVAAVALKDNRLTFAWLDGEAQKKYCLFYLNSETVQETCGPRGYVPTEVPRLFIVRYKRNSTENEILAKKKATNIWNAYQEVDINIASQLVARYDGSEDVQEIIEWIAKIIEDGDTHELPYFVDNTPELIPDDSDPIWTRRAQGVLFAGSGLKHRIRSIISALRDRMKDPRVGPFFLLMACISFGTIWLQNSRPTQPAKPGAQTDEGADRRSRPKTERSKLKSPLNNETPTSITDEVPKDAYQMLPSDSDSD